MRTSTGSAPTFSTILSDGSGRRSVALTNGLVTSALMKRCFPYSAGAHPGCSRSASIGEVRFGCGRPISVRAPGSLGSTSLRPAGGLRMKRQRSLSALALNRTLTCCVRWWPTSGRLT